MMKIDFVVVLLSCFNIDFKLNCWVKRLSQGGTYSQPSMQAIGKTSHQGKDLGWQVSGTLKVTVQVDTWERSFSE